MTSRHEVHAPPLSQLDVLVLDCQATAAAPRGHLLELAWARVGASPTGPRADLIRLPEGERIPPAVTRVTGISPCMLHEAIDARVAWIALCRAASAFEQQPAPAVAHFARFETPFLTTLAGGVPPLDLVCTHEIARRLFPDLPRRSLRALAGYFGHAVGTLRRGAEHVEATARVWRELVPLLEAEGISTWCQLRAWLAGSRIAGTPRRRAWPMPRAVRLALPDAPGIYRLLRTSGDVLYVGKASSLHHRVNSHFRKQHGVHERALEMLSQARALSFETTPTVVEAALLESDEIKRLRPPYNVALAAEGRQVWFAAPGLRDRRARPSRRHPVGPLPSAEMLDQFAALARADPLTLGAGRRAPSEAVFHAGHARFCAAHAEMAPADLDVHARLLRLGTRLWQEGRRDRDADADDEAGAGRATPAWTPETVQLSLEWLVIRAALALRRAAWLTRLFDAAVAWAEPGSERDRLLVIEQGEVARREWVSRGTAPPIPPGQGRTVAARHAAFTIERFDRLRVLTTELRRVASDGGTAAVRFDAALPLDGERLARALWWV